jgi:hypothetical protein
VDWSTVWVINYGAPYYPVSQRFSAPVSTISVIEHPAMFCLCLLNISDHKAIKFLIFYNFEKVISKIFFRSNC